MTAYRIGRVQLPWTNLEPPIRGGVHRKLEVNELRDVGEVADADTAAVDETLLKSDADLINIIHTDADQDSATEDTAEVSSLFSSPPFPLSSSNSSVGCDEDESARRVVLPPNTSGQQQNGAKTSPPTAPFPTDKLSRETYTAALEQKEIADGIRNYPSLDPETQEAIRAEYKALHKLVQEQGHYNCRYSEYGKEMIRYTMLFCTFLYFVHIEWYLTSACFLGMFWVCHMQFITPSWHVHCLCWASQLANLALLTSNKSCSLLMMPVTVVSLATSLPTPSSAPLLLTSATASRLGGGRARTTCTTW